VIPFPFVVETFNVWSLFTLHHTTLARSGSSTKQAQEHFFATTFGCSIMGMILWY